MTNQDSDSTMRTADVVEQCGHVHQWRAYTPDNGYTVVGRGCDCGAREWLNTSPVPKEDVLEAAGFAKRYRLCGHPAYPDPLNIWPPTTENATRIHEQYCAQSFEDYIAALGHTPRRMGGGPMTAADFNPRVLIVWEHVGEKQVFTPHLTPLGSSGE